MSEWISIVPFTVDDFVGTKPSTSATGTNNNNMSVPGSGGTPSITYEIVYDLQDENGEAITDQNGEIISLEGLTYA